MGVHGAEALIALGGAFLAAGLLGRIGTRIELPTIPLFMAAGILFGPNTPGLSLVEHPDELALVASLGLVFLLFSLGLEFSLEQLTAGGRRLGLASGAYLVLNVGGGLVFGALLGWGLAETLAIAGILGISSSAIVSKLLVELGRLARPETPVILGIIVVEDIFLAFYLALLQPVLGGAGSPQEAGLAVARAFALLLALALVARFGARLVGRVVGGPSDEIVVVLFVGLAVVTAGVAERFGVSDAIGAFMAGLILASTPSAERIRGLTHPLRDAFAAIFFFHFGLTIEPGAVGEVLLPVALAVAMTVVLAVLAGLVAGRVFSLDRGRGLTIGLTVLSRGEFSLILAALAVGAGLDERLAPFAAGYVLVLAILGPLLVTRADRLARRVEPRREEELVAS